MERTSVSGRSAGTFPRAETTLLEFYGLREQPFGPTPDPRYLYPSPSHRETATALIRGINSGCAFLALIASPGMGKTSIVTQLLQDLKDTARTAFLFQTKCTEREFLQYLAADLGIADANGNVASIHAKLNELLVEEAEAGRRVVLVIDEAQNLSESVLEMVRMLSNFETPHRKLLQIVLSGQPQLADKLSRSSMAQLLQRISILCHLKPLTSAEVEGFVNHRLQVAGYLGDSLFPPGTMTSIAKGSRGIPRLINDICFSSLMKGFEMSSQTIDVKIVSEVLSDLNLRSLMLEIHTSPVRQVPKRRRIASYLRPLLQI